MGVEHGKAGPGRPVEPLVAHPRGGRHDPLLIEDVAFAEVAEVVDVGGEHGIPKLTVGRPHKGSIVQRETE